MENAKQQLVDRIKSASNVLVTVGRNPSVDALSALLGLTLVLNKQGKHAAAVFSGQVPSTIEFLQPEETIEKNTDSLRDFIIALDKNKADKLRYKVEDNVVRIFITPYKTSISQEDFEFSEGDFNIDVVIALGVLKQEDLDEAITAHGRILHDATVASINIMPDGGLGSINWYEPQASSLSELVTDLTQMLGANLLDEQIATALLTGIVAETDRFSNDKTSSVAMSMSAALMKAGANQQLVASKLEGQLDVNGPNVSDESQNDGNTQQSGDSNSDDQSSSQDDGAIRIDHTGTLSDASENSDSDQPLGSDSGALPEINTSDRATEVDSPPAQDGILKNNLSTGSRLMTEPPTLGGTLTANSSLPDAEPSIDPLSLTNAEANESASEKNEPTDTKAPDLPQLTQPSAPVQVSTSLLPVPPPAAPPSLTPAPPSWAPPPPPPPPPPPTSTPAPLPPPPPPPPPPAPPVAPAVPATPPAPSTVNLADINKDGTETLADIEQAVASSHIKNETVDEARDEVKRAYNDSSVPNNDPLPPIDALNAQQLGGELHPGTTDTDAPQPPTVTDAAAPPPVPPPIPFQFGNPPPSA